MKLRRSVSLILPLGAALLLGGAVTSCASAPTSLENAAPQAEAGPQNAIATSDASRGAEAGAPLDTVLPPSQMVKTAQMTLEVGSIPDSLTEMRAIAQRYQGEVTGLQDQTPMDSGDRHTAWVELRIPQANLETTLDALSQLGTVRQQSITAEDVAAQLVDYEARLKNLRQTEAMLLDIMGRSGEMADVLRVAQEVSTVRQAIESIDAQQTQLRSRVAYSVISLDLRETAPALPPGTPLLEDLQNTWQQATHSVGQVTIGLLKLATWLAAYSPYLFILVLGSWLYRRHRHTAMAPKPSAPDTSDA